MAQNAMAVAAASANVGTSASRKAPGVGVMMEVRDMRDLLSHLAGASDRKRVAKGSRTIAAGQYASPRLRVAKRRAAASASTLTARRKRL
jgi:hypothetical protein